MSAAFAPVWPARLENTVAKGRMVFVCEHASCAFPAEFGTLGLTPALQTAHIAWDLGALGLARALALRLDGPLIHAEVSRLIYDCNRPPDAPGAMAAQSEIHDIPGNQGLSPAQKYARVTAVYEPFHATLRSELLRRFTLGLQPVLVTIHSFTPVWHGQTRAVEFGVIHDADPSLAHAVVQTARTVPLITRLNEPYSASDDVTHTLRLHATPYGLPSVMLEIRNDLIATPDAQTRMAALLAPVLARALASLSTPRITKTG